MIRGTTPSIFFNLPHELDRISEFELVIAQDCHTLLVFDKSRVSESDRVSTSLKKKKYFVQLTQEETLELSSKVFAKIQCRYKIDNGEVFASKIEKFEVERLLKDGVL